MYTRALLIVAFLVLVISGSALAQSTAASGETLEGLIVSLYAGAVRIVGLAAFLMILYAGVLRLLPERFGGNVTKSNQALQDAVIGTVLLLSSVLILQAVNPDTIEQSRGVFDESRYGDLTGAEQAGGAILPIIVQ